MADKPRHTGPDALIAGDENAQRTETYIGSFVQVRAKELGANISDSQVREIASGIAGRLTPGQRAGTSSINMGDVSGAIEAELRRQSDASKPVNLYSADAARIDAQNGGGRLATDSGLFAGNLLRGRSGEGENGSGEPGSSRRFESIGAYTEMQRQALDLARKTGLDWAANNPDLLRLGPSAIQALADVQLQKESYQRFQQGGLSAKTIVEGARWAKKNHVDLNEASRAYQATHEHLTPEQQKEHQKATEGLFNSHAGPPAEQEAVKKRYNDTMDRLKKSNPSAAPQIEREQQILKTATKQERVATAAADKKELAARNKDADANQKEQTADALLAQLNDSKSPGAKTTDSKKQPDGKKAAAKPVKPAAPA